MLKVATLHARGLISDEALTHVVYALFEKTASSSAARKVLKETIGQLSPAPTASKLKQILIKTRMARPHALVRNSSPNSEWHNLPGWKGKLKGNKDIPKWFEGDAVHGGPRLRATPLGKVVGYGAPAVGGLAVAHGVGNASEAARRKRTSRKGFKAMIKSNPDVAKMDEDKVRASFKTMTRLAPDLAADPQISGAFVRRTAGDFAEIGIDPKSARDLLDVQNAFLKSKSERGSFSNAIKALGIGTMGLGA